MPQVIPPFLVQRTKEPFVGEVHADVRVENAFDRAVADRGFASADSIRVETVAMVVDTGAVTLVLPEEVVDRLGLTRTQKVEVTYADGRNDELWEADGAFITVLGREALVRCVVGRRGTEALLGQIPLEIMDLLVDCNRRELVVNPRSPERPAYRI